MSKFNRYWLPVLVWMAVIFVFSSQSHHQQDLKPFLKKEIPDRVKVEISHSNYIPGVKKAGLSKWDVPGFLEMLIRKTAHLFVYGILGLLLYRAFTATVRRTRMAAAAASVASAVLYAVSDEYHQSFIPDRTAKLSDIQMDLIGACIGILLYVLIGTIKRWPRENAQ